MPLLALAVPAGVLGALRFVDPPGSAIMWARSAASPPCARIEYDWIDASKLPAFVGWSAVAAEDQRFFLHAGFDYAQIRDAVADRLEGDRLRGASTISQQVSKNLLLWSGRSVVRKALEAYLTVWLEALWPKPRILEVYLNVAQFGSCTFGVEAASRRFFGKSASALTAHEAALLMTALPDPEGRRPDVPSAWQRDRARWIRQHAETLERITPRDAGRRPARASSPRRARATLEPGARSS